MLKSVKFFSIILLGMVLISNSACKKAVDKVQENAINAIITNGQWRVTRFDVAATPKASEYEGYAFRFFSNGVVTASKAGEPDINGTWSSNTTNVTITSNFPGSGATLERFNGVWFITGFTEVTVQAIKSEGADEYSLGLRKL